MVKLRGKAWWKNFFGKIWLSYYVEKLGGNLVLNVCFFYAANWEEQFGGKIYGQNVLEKLG